MIEVADILATICEAAQVRIPSNLKFDGHSFLPKLRGEKGNPKDALYVWYNPSGGSKAQLEFAVEARYKLYADGRFFDTIDDDRKKSPLMQAELSIETKAIKTKLQTLLDANRVPRDEYFVKQAESFGEQPGGKIGSAYVGKKGKLAKNEATSAPKTEVDPRNDPFKEHDAKHDDKITYEEFQSSMVDKKVAKERFGFRDLNKDGGLSLEEFLATLPKTK